MRRGYPSERQWHLYFLLCESTYGATLAELARALGVRSERTIRRDLEVMDYCGVSIEYEKVSGSRTPRVKLAENARVPKLNFTAAELLSLYFSSHMLRALQGTVMKRGVDSVMRKIERMLPASQLAFAARARGSLVAKAAPLRAYQEQARMIQALEQASAGRKKIEIVYHALHRPHTDRHTAHPYCVACVDQALYLIAFSEQRGAIRHFLVDRIRKVRKLRAPFALPKDFDADAYLGESFGIYREGPAHHVKIEFTAKIARWVEERTWHPSQALTRRADGGLLLTMKVAGLEDVMRWVLGFGGEAKVMAPPELVERTRKELAAGAGRYV